MVGDYPPPNYNYLYRKRQWLLFTIIACRFCHYIFDLILSGGVGYKGLVER